MLFRSLLSKAIGLGISLFLRQKQSLPSVTSELHEELTPGVQKFKQQIVNLNFHYKQINRIHREGILNKQILQSRIADASMWLFAMGCVLSKLNSKLSSAKNTEVKNEFDITSGLHFLNIASVEIDKSLTALYEHSDALIEYTAHAALSFADTLDDAHFVFPEKSPVHPKQSQTESPELTRKTTD